jgi:cation/acetate symporter
MAIGFLVGCWYLYHVRFAGGTPWLGLDHLRFGIVGMASSLIAMVSVSLATEEPDEETQAMVDAIRIPGGKTILDDVQ